MQQPIDFSKPQRQSAIVTLIAVLQSLKQAWPFVLFFIVSKIIKQDNNNGNKENSSLIILYSSLGVLAVFIIAKFNEVIQYFTLRYYISDGFFVVTNGLFTKTKTTIPLSNIQTIQTEQQLLHRLTNTYKLNIDTPGSNKAEVSLLAIQKEQYMALLQIVEQHALNTNELSFTNTNTSNYNLSWTDLIKLGISENHIKTFFLIVFFVIGKLQDVKQYLGIDYIDKASNETKKVYNNVEVVSLLVAFVLLITLVVSFIMVALKYANMVISQKQKGLHITWGLVNTTQKFIQQQKTQLLIWHTNFFRNLLGLSTMRLYAIDENEAIVKSHIQLAISSKQLLQHLLTFYIPTYTTDNNLFVKPNKKIISRTISIIGIPIFIICFGVTYYFFKWYALLWLIWLAYHIVARIIYWKKYAIWFKPHYIQIKKGVWGTENILLKYEHIQFVSIKTTPYKRSQNLADIVLYTAGKNITVPYLQLEQANQMANYILAYIEGMEIDE